MHAMQYEITLPADYDMGIIRHRVATRGSGTDTFGGLGLKVYAIREGGSNGSSVNQYAPFYLWANPAGMNAFLLGPGFAGLARDFGRPAVRHWTGLAFHRGPARDAAARMATRTTSRIPADTPVGDAIDAALAEVDGSAHAAGVHCTALAIDPLHWEIVHFTVWAGPVPDVAGVRYEVLHTSSPQIQDLPQGRQW